MKKIIFIIAFLSIGLSSYAQISTNSKWDGHYYLPMDFVFNGRYFVLKNVETVRIPPQAGTLLHVLGYDGTTNTRITVDAYSNTVRGGALTFRRLRGDTLNPTPPLLDDVLGSINTDGWTPNGFLNSSSGGIVIRARQNFANGNRGTYTAVQATRSGDTVNREVARFDEKGVKYSNVAFTVGNSLIDSTFGKNSLGEQVTLEPIGTKLKITDTSQLVAKRDTPNLFYTKFAAKADVTQLAIYKTLASFNSDSVNFATNADLTDVYAKINLKTNLSDTSTFATNNDIADLQVKINTKQNAGVGIPVYVPMVNAMVSTIIGRANIPEMVYSVVAGKSYSIKFNGSYISALTTTGGSLGVILTGGGIGSIVGNMEGEISTGSAVATGLKNSIVVIDALGTNANSFLTTSGVSSVSLGQNFTMDVIFKCTTSGVFQLQWGSEVALSAATLQATGGMIVTQLN